MAPRSRSSPTPTTTHGSASVPGVVARATARPVCEALQWALRTHGVPDQILTDNGKVFTARFGQGPGPVLFDRICANNGIRHLLTAPYSPTTTGKVERFHRTIRRDFLVDHDRVHVTIEERAADLDTLSSTWPEEAYAMVSP
jgi:transposase InsO family protein